MNTPRSMHRSLLAITILVLAAMACSLFSGGGVAPLPTQLPQQQPLPQVPVPSTSEQPTPRATLIAATVQIYGTKNQNGSLTPMYVGSGTIISPTGMILTNAHVASPASQGDFEYEPDVLVIGLIESEDKPPVMSYVAQIYAVDGFLDLAVIQIISTVNGAAVDTNSLRLPYVPLGNSDEVHVGDHINIFGFPSIGGETITYTDGNISGFVSEDQVGDRAWIKTDATISGGNSGGLAANDNGQIVGVPTIASSGAGGKATDCRVIQDTNGDGRLTEADTCIPIGGFINALRPIKLAMPLIQAVQNGQTYVSPFSQSGSTAQGSGNETFGPVRWYTVTDLDACAVGEEVSSYPSGTKAISAVFTYSGMTQSQSWAEIWTLNGEEILSGQYSWNQDSQGEFSDCIYFPSGEPLDDGQYGIKLFAGNDLPLLSEGAVSIGGGGAAPATGSVQLYGKVYDDSTNKPIANALVFILNSGVTYEQWSGANYPDSDVFAYTRTDNSGNYQMPTKIARNTPYTLVAAADGYYNQYGNNLVWNDSDPAQYQLDIGLDR